MLDHGKQWLNFLGLHPNDNTVCALMCLFMLLLGLILGYLYAHIKYRKTQQQSLQDKERMQTHLDEQIDHLSHIFSSLSQDALQKNSELFLQLAQQKMEHIQQQNTHQLSIKEHNIRHLLSPIKDSLKKTDEQLQKLNIARNVSETKLTEHINHLTLSQKELQQETRKLTNALRRPEVRGQWGEISLRRLVELAGMNQYCDFSEQATVHRDNSRLRPDMLIHMPSGRTVVVDVKTSLDAYLSAHETNDEQEQVQLLQQHSKNIKLRIRELATKKYWQQFTQSPEFVVLFIPGEQFLHAALQQDNSLLEYAFNQKIILSTPTSFIALLKTIAYGWKQEKISENSQKIQLLADTLSQQIETLTSHLDTLGKQLNRSMEQFNRFNHQYQSKIAASAKQLRDLDIDSA